MVDDRTVLYTLAGVALILLAIILYNNKKAQQERLDGPPPLPASDEEEGDLDDPLLLKFVRHDGHVVGETFARDGDRLILKQAGVYKSVPLAMASVDGDEVELRGDIDWTHAIEEGSAWHQSHTTGHDPLVTENLTRSEDVQKPALEATKDEEE